MCADHHFKSRRAEEERRNAGLPVGAQANGGGAVALSPCCPRFPWLFYNIKVFIKVITCKKSCERLVIRSHSTLSPLWPLPQRQPLLASAVVSCLSYFLVSTRYKHTTFYGCECFTQELTAECLRPFRPHPGANSLWKMTLLPVFSVCGQCWRCRV